MLRAILTAAVFATSAGADVAVLPPLVELHGPEAAGKVLLQQTAGESVGANVADVAWSVADESVATVSEGGVVMPVGDGETTLTAAAGGETATARVVVRGAAGEFDWSFRNQVLPVLAKQGCNMGACHGALAGKGGFRLSLRGYDPEADFYAITREARGRRVETADPGRSLLLAKPSGAVAHKGGLKLPQDSDEYRVLAEWVSAGTPAPSDDDATLESLSVYPDRATLSVGDRQPLVVRARYSDGREEDVTRWVKWTSADASVCDVSEDGLVTVTGSGEGAVSAWFSSQIVMARVTSPYPNDVGPTAYEDFPVANFIDAEARDQWRRLNLPPSGRADDATYVRRASLDATGRLPTAERLAAFVADGAADKRAKLVDELLASDAFVDYWAYRWSDVFLVNGSLLRPKAVEAYYAWIRGHVEANTPWDEVARDLVTAVGASDSNGATNFYALHQTPEEMTENVCKAFMGLSIGCAKCHNHPLEKWTNDQYYAMASHFSRVRAKGWGGDPRSGDGVRTLFVAAEGELVQPNAGVAMPPTPLDGEPIGFDYEGDRRGPLADWLTSPENPYFAKAAANRVWAAYFGVGLVEEVDDLRVSNPASNEALLQAAADHLVGNDFDLKSLMRAILNSQTYQRSSDVLPGNAADRRFYTRYYPRRLPAEVLLDAVTDVTGVEEKFTESVFPGEDRYETDI